MIIYGDYRDYPESEQFDEDQYEVDLAYQEEQEELNDLD